MKITNTLISLGACLALAFTAGCKTEPKITTHPDPDVAYSNYKTFAMIRPVLLMTIGNAEISPTLIRQVRDGAEAAMAGQGLVKTQSNADLIVLVHGGIEAKTDITQLGFGYGRFGRSVGSQYDIDQYNQGRLIVDMFDSRTRELVWRGIAEADIADQPDPAMAAAAVRAIVARYPN